MTSATLLERDGDPAPEASRGRVSANPGRGRSASRRSGWRVVATSGTQPCARPEEGDTEVPIGDLALVLRGRVLPAEDGRVLVAFAAQAAVALRQRRLADAAAEAGPLAEADRTRTALLAAVSHDLRTPSPRPRPWSPRCAARACSGRTPSGPSCWPPPTSRWTG
jgi:two-component system sensor histidine kinase KdpD